MRIAALSLLLALAPAGRAFADGAPAAPAASPAASAGTVNINSATVDELVRLPGVGPSKAAAVAAFRQKHGPFKRIEDLDRVKGFGRKLLARIRPYVGLSGPTTFVGKHGASKLTTQLERTSSD